MAIAGSLKLHPSYRFPSFGPSSCLMCPSVFGSSAAGEEAMGHQRSSAAADVIAPEWRFVKRVILYGNTWYFKKNCI